MGAAIATAVSAAAALAMTGYELSGAGNPSYPNAQASSARLSNAQAEMLPLQRALQAAAQQGKSITLNLPQHQTTQTLAFVSNPVTVQTGRGPGRVINEGQWVPYNAADWQPGGKYNPNGTAQPPRTKTKMVKVPAGPQTFDFSGYGAADVQGKLADAMAQVQLALGQKYDSQFIDQALKQEQLADPEGFAARQRMNDLIQEQNARPLNEPVAQNLSDQVQAEIDAANNGTLDPQMRDLLMQGGNSAEADRGGASPSNAPDFLHEATTGTGETQRQLAAIGKGTSELAGGESPEDIAYRREQQNLANLSSEVQGITPQSQFKSLSGAQQGPTPFVPGQPLPNLPSSQGAQGAALNAWQTQMQQAQSQAQPWMAGLSTLLGAANTAANLGWQPGATG